MYHVGRPGEDGYANRVAAGVGHRRPQQPHQRLLVVRAARTFPLVRQRSAVAGLRERRDDPAAVVASRDRPLLQPTRAAHHRGQIERRDAHRHRSPPVEHVGQGEHVAAGVFRDRRRAAAGDGRTCCSHEDLYDREFVRTWVDWRGYLRAGRPDLCRHVRQLHRRVEGALRASSRPSSPRRRRASTPAQIVEAARAHRPRARPLQHAQLAIRRRRQSRGAGRSRAVCICSSCSPDRSARKAASACICRTSSSPKHPTSADAAGLLERAAVSARVPRSHSSR